MLPGETSEAVLRQVLLGVGFYSRLYICMWCCVRSAGMRTCACTRAFLRNVRTLLSAQPRPLLDTYAIVDPHRQHPYILILVLPTVVNSYHSVAVSALEWQLIHTLRMTLAQHCRSARTCSKFIDTWEVSVTDSVRHPPLICCSKIHKQIMHTSS